ncbi:DgyrCDS5941 [Dimorphilus gyrociliatus]|uniref:DgyrCDS5941 n=1 Tax=Dimorphilus gyrociliatus TaxID=2664684 RepID=A0A7I8VLL1_9ANNE|nr:DgyrCDS5941 [Dimorphilus gyrociliatus]
MSGNNDEKEKLFQSLQSQFSEDDEGNHETSLIRQIYLSGSKATTDDESALIAELLGEECPSTSAQSREDTEIGRNTKIQGVDENILQQYLMGKISFEEFNDYLHPAKLDSSDDEAKSELADEPASKRKKLDKKKSEKVQTPIKRFGRLERSKLPPALQGLMGQANLKCASNQYDEAIKICTEIIKQEPTANEPYGTLQYIYEEKGDLEKCLQCGLINAVLTPFKEPEEWQKLGRMGLKLENTSQALFCFRKAAALDKDNMELNWFLASLLLENGQYYQAALTLSTMLKHVKDDDEKWNVYIALLEAYLKTEKLENAMKTFRAAFAEFPSKVTEKDMNQALEICLRKQNFNLGIEIISNFKGVDIKKDENTSEIIAINIPDEIPIEIRAKVLVCLLQNTAKPSRAIEEIVEPILSRPYGHETEKMQIIDALITSGFYEKAAKILKHLLDHIKTESTLWSKYGRCLQATSKANEALDAYEKSLKLKSDADVLLTMSALYNQLGRHKEALKCLEHDQEDARILLQRGLMLYAQEKYTNFVELADKLFYSKFEVCYKKRKFLNEVHCQRGAKHRLEVIRNIFNSIEKDSLRRTLEYFKHIPVENMYDLYTKMCQAYLKLKDNKGLLRISQLGILYPPFVTDRSKAEQVDLILVMTCLKTKTTDLIFRILREYCTTMPQLPQVWNFYGQLCMYDLDGRHARFLSRLQAKSPDSKPLKMLLGHYSLTKSNYRDALKEFMEVYISDKDNAFVCLCIGVALTNLMSVRTEKKKNWLVGQAAAFFSKYKEKRKFDQESYYNLGRAMHQMGLLHLAVEMYEKALACPSVESEDFNLKKETAYNLSRIYLDSGSKNLARMVLSNYCVIR